MCSRIILLTIGTRGDVQPLIALALGLKKAGYRTKLAAPANYQAWIESYGLKFSRCGGDFREFVQSSGKKFGSDAVEQMARDCVIATRDADAVIFHPKVAFAIDVAEAKSIPAIMAAFQPLTPTREFPLVIIPKLTLGGFLNHSSYQLLRLESLLYGGIYNKCRRELLGLDPKSRLRDPFTLFGAPIPILYAVSPRVVARPHDWPEHVHLTGYWFLDGQPRAAPNGRLDQFIDAGEPPLYVGFGSMPVRNPEERARLLVEAIGAVGRRVVLHKGWGNLNPASSGWLPEHVHLIDTAPHEHLFPRMSGVVHHGGAGTTAAGLRAGCPTLVCPFFGDQPYWALQVQRLGAGPAPLPPQRWRKGALMHAFRKLTETPGYRTTAGCISRQIASENGVERAVEVVQSLVRQH
jgi:sterol 3beta-glucosyltransferase